jgi:hypothetical protein
MRCALEDDWGPETDVETTAEFPALDVAAYEARQDASGSRPILPSAQDFELASHHGPPPPALEPPHYDVLLKMRTVLAKADAGGDEPPPAPTRTWPDARAWCRNATAVSPADGPSSALAAEFGPSGGQVTSITPWQVAYEAELESMRRLVEAVLQAQAGQERDRAEAKRTLDEQTTQMARLEAELAAVHCRIDVANQGRARGPSEARRDVALLARSVLDALARIVPRR